MQGLRNIFHFVLDELTQLMVGDVLIRCALFLLSWWWLFLKLVEHHFQMCGVCEFGEEDALRKGVHEMCAGGVSEEQLPAVMLQFVLLACLLVQIL